MTADRLPADRPAVRPGYQKPDPRVGSVSGMAAAGWAGARMTARGAVIAMFSLYFLGMLAAGWLHLGSLIGLSFVAGCVLAARYTKRDGLLTAVLTPPLIFMIALAITQTMSAHADTLRRTLTSAVEGIVLNLASVAPWLFSGVILGIVVATSGGLRRCVGEFRADSRAGAGQRPEPSIRRSAPPDTLRPSGPAGTLRLSAPLGTSRSSSAPPSSGAPGSSGASSRPGLPADPVYPAQPTHVAPPGLPRRPHNFPRP